MNLSEFSKIRDNQTLSTEKADLSDKNYFFNELKSIKKYDFFRSVSDFSSRVESQNYNHGKLTTAQYMSHPYRVAARVLEYFPDEDETYLKLALCHNIIELSVVSDSLSDYLGSEMMGYVRVLTVDRSVQWDLSYKASYYESLGEHKITRVIKAFDKLDNLFTLCVNPDRNIKLMYLREIEANIMPIVLQDMPFLEDYFSCIIKINYDLLN